MSLLINDLMLVFAHQKSRWILPFNVCPSSCKMYEEHAWLETFFVSLIKTFDLFWECIDAVLRNHDKPVLQECRLEHDVAHAILLTHLMLICCICLMIFDHAVEEIVSSRCGTGDERSGVQWETTTRIR